MSHALIWSEINSSNSTETYREISRVGFGTNVSETWTKKLFKLKWINSSVEDVKLWIDHEYADVYTGSHYPTIKNTDGLKLLSDLGFDLRFTIFDSFTISDLPNADAATTSNLSLTSIGGVNRLTTPKYVDGVALDVNKLVLVKDQTDLKQNGLYKILTSSGSGTVLPVTIENVLTVGKIVSVGSSSFYAYNDYLTPFQTVAAGTTEITWVSRTNRYQLSDVTCATTENLFTSGAGLTVSNITLDNRTLVLNDRVLVKDQTTRSQNGIYFVSSTRKSNASTIYNPYTSSLTADDFWDTALSNINANKPVSVQTILAGTSNTGAYLRFFSATGLTGGTASTSNLLWTDGTYNYNYAATDYYYEIGSGSTAIFRIESGVLLQTASVVSTGNGNTAALNVGNRLLVKYSSVPAASGIYVVSSVGSSNVWTRANDFDTSSEIRQTVVKVSSTVNSINGNIFYLGKTNTYNNNFSINYDPITVQERFYPYTYSPVSNLINSNISSFASVNEKLFATSAIGITQRVLVTGQNTKSQNGIYQVSGVCDVVFGLDFYSSYNVERGSLAIINNGTTGAGTSYFLYAPGTTSSAGAVGVTFVNITNAPTVIARAETNQDKFSSGYFIPGDFDVNVSLGTTVLVNTSNNLINGLYYVSSIGESRKRVFDFADGLVNWSKDILTSVLTNNTDSTYFISPNLKKQIQGVYQASSIASTHYGEIFVPEIVLPSSQNYENFFGIDGKSSSFLQEIDIDWYEQDYQKFNVRAIYYNSSANIPTTTGTAISSLVRQKGGSGTTLIQPFESILVFVSSGTASTHIKNGIYRPNYTGVGSVYFTPHEDFYYTTKFESGTNRKSLASPYERPTLVNVDYGYFVAGTALSIDRAYMQSELGIRGGFTGTSYITADDDTVLNSGSEIYIRDSEVRITTESNNLSKLPRIAPIQHILEADTTRDQVNGDMVTVKRGSSLGSTIPSDANVYNFEIEDRVFYYVSSEDEHNSTVRKSTSGVYQIVHIDGNLNYYLRKVKYNSVNGHLDYAKRLVSLSSTGSSISLAREDSPTNQYYWSSNNYPDSLLDVYVVSTGNTVINKTYSTDYTVDSKNGALLISGSGWTGTVHVYLYRDTTIPKYNQTAKQLFNRYHYVPQVLKNRTFVKNSSAKTSAGLNEDNSYFQIVNSIGTATTTEKKFNRDRSSWIKQFSSAKNYTSYIHNIFESDSTSNYFFTQRLSSDGFTVSAGTANTSLFTNVGTDPVTKTNIGLYYGELYLEKIINSGTGATLTAWYSGLGFSADSNVLVLTNKTTSSYSDKIIDLAYQSKYYNDKGVLVTHDKTGKRDQKIFKFKRSEYSRVGLGYTYNFAGAAFTSIYVSVQNSAGVGTYSLYYDPASTNVSTSDRSWIDISTRTVYNCAVGTTFSASSFNDLTQSVFYPLGAPSGYSGTAITAYIDGYKINENELVVVKTQNDSSKNGIYSVVQNTNWILDRAEDLNTNSEVYSLGQVSYNDRTFELVPPSIGGTFYNLGSSAMNAHLYWKQLQADYVMDVVGISTANYTLTSLPDSINGIGVSDGDKIFLYAQSSEAERYVARYKTTNIPTLSRVNSGSGVTQFQISSLYVNDSNRNKSYELYFNPSNTTVGSDNISWFEVGSISNFTACGFATTGNINLGQSINIFGIQKGDRLLVKDQSDKKQNGIYVIDENISFFLDRHESLSKNSQISLTKRINVIGGNTNLGYYGLVYDEAITSPGIGITPIYFALVNQNPYATDVKVASNSNINLSAPQSMIDGIYLSKYDRVLVKNQTDKTQNGIYVVASIGSTNTWARATDLDSSVEVKPQITVFVGSGTTYSDTSFRIKLPTPRTLTNTQPTQYILGTDNIDWVSTETDANYDSSPDTWQEINSGYANAVNLGNAKLGIEQTSRSKTFGLAIKTPSATNLATNNITANGQVRNIKLKVEYKTVKD